jgi:3-oxoacyl-[acyl-carrier protein] reductase
MTQIAVVTGGAKNIGRAISLRLKADGYRVFVLDIDEPDDDALRADFRRVDLSDAAATDAAAREVAAKHQVTRLVNNVGIVRPAGIDDVSLDDFDMLFHLNVRTSIICAKIFIETMRAAGQGRIVMNTSRVTKGKEARTLYSATKGAIQSMARTWALELGKDRITVNCVAPGPIATTAFWKNNDPESDYTRKLIASIPVGRMGTPDDVANAVSFFCDPRSDFVTGQTLFVCGGVTVG